MLVKKTTVCFNLQHKWRKEALDQISTSDGLLSSVHYAADLKVHVSIQVTTTRKTHVFSNACILHLRSHVHNFNSIGWLCLCPKKERAREVLKNSHFFTALTSLNNQLLPFLWKEADHCVLQATKEICLLLCFCLLLCTKKRFKMMSKHPLSTSSKLTKIWADHVQEAQKTLSFTE